MNNMKPPAEIVADNEDMLAEILLNLPPRSLIRFKSVCKAWNLLISCRHFSRLHSSHHPQINGFLLHHPNRPYLELSPINPTLPTSNLRFPVDSASSNFTILQSCNGLFLLLSSSTYGPTKSTYLYYVYNPTTNRCAIIPPPPPRYPLGGDDGGTSNSLWASLAFKYTSSELQNQYRVIHVSPSSSASPNRFEIQLYDSSVGHWIREKETFTAPFGMSFCNGVYWNGSIHWIGPNGEGLRFRVDTDRRVEMIPPVPLGNNRGSSSSGARRQRVVQESGGRLFLIETYGKSNPLFEIFEMKGDYSGWDVKYKVDISGIIDTYPEMVMKSPDGDAVVLGCQNHYYYAFQVCSVVMVVDDDDMLVLRIPGKLIGYSLKEKRYQMISEVVPSSASASRFEWVDVFPFQETLTWV